VGKNISLKSSCLYLLCFSFTSIHVSASGISCIMLIFTHIEKLDNNQIMHLVTVLFAKHYQQPDAKNRFK
jgi:hypothetical protein